MLCSHRVKMFEKNNEKKPYAVVFSLAESDFAARQVEKSSSSDVAFVFGFAKTIRKCVTSETALAYSDNRTKEIKFSRRHCRRCRVRVR